MHILLIFKVKRTLNTTYAAISLYKLTDLKMKVSEAYKKNTKSLSACNFHCPKWQVRGTEKVKASSG